MRSGRYLPRLEILVTTQDTQSERDDARVNVVEEAHAPHTPDTGVAQSGGETASPSGAQKLPADEQTARPFTAYIEEFRQREALPAASLAEPFSALLTTRAANDAAAHDTPDASVETRQGEEASSMITPTIPAERPVSPLLRPATRMRAPRHGGRHHQEAASKTAQEATPANTEAAAKATQAATYSSAAIQA